MYRVVLVLLTMAAPGCNGDGKEVARETGVAGDTAFTGDTTVVGDTTVAGDAAGVGDTGVPGDSFVFGDVSKTDVFIYAFDAKQLMVGLTDTVDVILSGPVKTKVYVEVTNSNPQVVQVSYGSQIDNTIVIKFNVGQQKKTVNLKALKAGTATITFKIYGHNTWSILSVKATPAS